MAVYTHLSEEDLKQHLKRFNIGALTSFSGITDGVENTNYRLTTGKGNFILTLFEKRVRAEDLPFFISFMEYLNGRGIPCPRIVETVDGEKILSLAGKPSVISTFLKGASPRPIRDFHAAETGKTLALMHLAGKDFALRHDNAMSLPAWKKLIDDCGKKADALEPGLTRLLQRELRYIEKNWPQNLPSGTVHADLFPDNVFFTGSRLTGVIDFYFSCTDVFAYDLMLTLNAWCFDGSGRPDGALVSALLQAYQKTRPLSSSEKGALSFFGRGAALRIIATRLYDFLHPVKGSIVKIKDPMEYVHILKFHQKEKIIP